MSYPTAIQGAKDTGPGPSTGSVFNDRSLNYGLLLNNPTAGTAFFDDFLQPLTFVSATAQGGYMTFFDSSCTIKAATSADTDDATGILQMISNGTDNDEMSIQMMSGAAGGLVEVDSRADGGRNWAMEARVRLRQIATQGAFVGVMSGGNATTATLIDDGCELKATIGVIGFHIDEADADDWRTKYKASGQTEQDPAAASVKNITASQEWVKLGLAYTCDGAVETLRWFVDGEIKATLTKDAENATTFTAATFPDNVRMSPIIVFKDAAGSGNAEMDIDWIMLTIERN